MNQTWTRSMLKENAKRVFKKNYWLCVGVTFILTVLGSGAGNLGSSGSAAGYERSYFTDVPTEVISIILVIILIAAAVMLALDIFVFNVIEVGGKMFFVQNRSYRPAAGVIFDGFKKGRYGNVVKTMFFMDLYVFLWSLLFLIPGIVKSYEYLMVPYILAENPTMDRRDVFALSKRMMDGEKWKAFVLSLSFIGWILLNSITCGLVGIFYLNPYYAATFTELYAFNKIKAYNEGYIR